MPLLGVGIFGWLPMLAAVAMATSSVTVVGNSMPLGRYKPRLTLTRTELRKNYIQETANEKQVVDDVISKTSFG